MKSRNRIIIYNLETDKNSLVLSSAIYWLAAFSNDFDYVQVYSIHVGDYELSRNVSVTEIGGGNLLKKVRGFTRLVVSVVKAIPYRKRTVVFHHMSSRTAGTIGMFYFLLRIPQGLWYAHSHADPFLKASLKWINYFFTPSSKSFPLESKKIIYTGHGIPTDRFSKFQSSPRSGVVSIGRIARIKNIQDGVVAIAESNLADKTLHLYGSAARGDEYPRELTKLAESKNVRIQFHGPINYEILPEELLKYSIIFSGTPKSTDKALLEGAASGCFPLTNNGDAEKLTGMMGVWNDLQVDPKSSLSTKLSIVSNLLPQEALQYRKRISRATCASSDVKNTVNAIGNVLRSKN